MTALHLRFFQPFGLAGCSCVLYIGLWAFNMHTDTQNGTQGIGIGGITIISAGVGIQTKTNETRDDVMVEPVALLSTNLSHSISIGEIK